MRINSRSKGISGEREIIDHLQPVVNELFQVFGREPPRLQRNTLQSDVGGCDIVGLDWLSMEVKFYKELIPSNIAKWWEQTLRQAGPKVPILFYRKNRGDWHVRMEGVLVCCGLRGSVSAVVTVDIETFGRWFRNRLWWELGDKQHGL
jgi:hypothetical protein